MQKYNACCQDFLLEELVDVFSQLQKQGVQALVKTFTVMPSDRNDDRLPSFWFFASFGDNQNLDFKLTERRNGEEVCVSVMKTQKNEK